MTTVGEYSYDEKSGIVSFVTEEGPVELYQDISPDEFKLISSIEDTYTAGTQLLDRLIDSIEERGRSFTSEYRSDDFSTLQNDAVAVFSEVERLEDEIKASSSEVISSQIYTLYKLKKFLQRYFRCLSVGQSLSFSQSLLFQYVTTQSYATLYGFVLNVCSTMDYLGRILLNRQGEGSVDISSQSTTCVDTYNRLSNQGLTESLSPEAEVEILPTRKTIQMGSVGLGKENMRWLWDRRNEIVHHCPMVVEEETAEDLPEELLPESILTQTDIVKIVHLSHRLHYDALGMFFSYTTEFIQEMMGEWVEAVYKSSDVEV